MIKIGRRSGAKFNPHHSPIGATSTSSQLNCVLRMRTTWKSSLPPTVSHAGLFILAGLLFLNLNVFSQDTNFFVFLCFGQSNMEGFPGIEEQDRASVDDRFQVLAAVDVPEL